MNRDKIYWEARKRAERILRSRPMKGLFASLTPEQQKAALEYDGPEVIGNGPYFDKEKQKALIESVKERHNGYLQRWLNHPKMRAYLDRFRKQDRD